MFCTNCGAQFADGAKFCPSCGAPVAAPTCTAPTGAAPEAPAATYVAPAGTTPVTTPAPKRKKKVWLIILIAAAATVTLAALLILVLSGNSGYKDYNDLIDDYFDAVADGDTADVLKLIHPSVIEYTETEGYYGDEVLEELDDLYDDGNYGYPIEYWNIEDIYYGDADDISLVKLALGVEVEDYIAVEVETGFAYGESEYYYFELICVDGRWFMADVY